MARIHKEVRWDHPASRGMVLQVHDQLVLDIHPSDWDKVDKVRKIMESVYPETNGIRLEVDVTWSERSFAEQDMKEEKEFVHAP